MNADRRMLGRVIVSLLVECHTIGLINDESHMTVTEALTHLQQAEYWQLKNQEKHEGKNASTDSQLRICRVALPALEAARHAWDQDDFTTVMTQVELAISTDGTVPKPIRKKGLRKSSR